MINNMKLKNKKVIVINAFGHGGSNILWNILQSHPQVCSAMLETTEIVFENLSLSQRNYFRSLLMRSSHNPILSRVSFRYLDNKFYKFKLRNLDDLDNRYKSENELYTREEVGNSVLCLKSLNEDIALTDLFTTMYDNIYFIGLIRNGYALCEGWVRRGTSSEKAGHYYHKYGMKMINDSKQMEKYLMIRFEDLITDPFNFASLIYQFAELDPVELDKLRLKSKKILTEEKGHRPVFGEENRKYWFDRNSIKEFLDKDISKRQSNLLTQQDKHTFESLAYPVLSHFDYLED